MLVSTPYWIRHGICISSTKIDASLLSPLLFLSRAVPWNPVYRWTLNYCAYINSIAWGALLQVTRELLHTDPHLSPVPDSGSLHPVRFIIPRRSRLLRVPVHGYPTSPIPSDRRQLPRLSLQNLARFPHESTPEAASPLRIHITTAIRLTPKPYKTRSQISS